MRRTVLGCSVFAALSIVAARASASTRPMDDMCSQPKMKTDKWQVRQEAGGMSLMVPPGFVTSGGDGDTHYYINGEHRSITVGLGTGMAIMRFRDISETGECETVIAGRRVTLTMYHWVVEDANLSASGNAGPHFAAVARFYSTGALRESYVQLVSNAPSDVKYFRQLFWTVSFPGSAAPVAPVADAPAAVATLASAPAASAPASAPAITPASAPACDPASVPGLPAADAVLDSGVVRMLIASAAPIPKGYELMALQFAGNGELSGMTVAQSDLPEASQRELTSVIATNLKPHDAHAPSTFLLRVDSSDTGLHYSVLPMSGCTH
jgi:hypothetical protein